MSTMARHAETWTTRLALAPVRRPVAVLIIAALVLAAAGVSISRLRFNPRLEALLPDDSASADALRRVQADFQLLDHALVLVSIEPVSGDEHAARPAQAQRLIAYAERFESAIRQDSEHRALIDAVITSLTVFHGMV